MIVPMLAATQIHPLEVPLWIDLAAVTVGALAGASIAIHEDFDLIGGFILAVALGLGGGIIRDLLLGLRPVALTHRAYLPTVVVAALAGYLFASLLRRFQKPFVVLDALSVALFTVVGVEKALLNQLWYPAAIFIGICAAVGGGILADLFSGTPVEVVRRGPWNATAALAGGVLYCVLTAVGARTGVCEALTLLLVFGMRIISLRFGFRTPAPPELSLVLRRSGGLLASRRKRPLNEGE